MIRTHPVRTLFLIVFVFVFALLLSAFLIPTATYAAGPSPQGTAPIEGSIVPVILQIALIVFVTEGIKSLGKALGLLQLEGREAAIAYIVVGVIVYSIQTFLLPALPGTAQTALSDFLTLLAMLLAGSGLFSMTSAFRVPSTERKV